MYCNIIRFAYFLGSEWDQNYQDRFRLRKIKEFQNTPIQEFEKTYAQTFCSSSSNFTIFTIFGNFYTLYRFLRNHGME